MLLMIAISGATVLLLGGGLVILLLLMTYLLGRHFRTARSQGTPSVNRTKYAEVDVFRHRLLFLRLGLVCALAWAVLAISWTVYQPRTLSEFVVLPEEPDVNNAPPITRQKPPSPPPPPPPVFEISTELDLLDTTSFQSMDVTAAEAVIATQTKTVRQPAISSPPPLVDLVVDNTEVPFKIVEDMPLFGDCAGQTDKAAKRLCSDRALIQAIGQRVQYPAVARENDVEGIAVVSFVVEKDGSMSSLTLLRDPGAGLGDEAMRVVESLMAEDVRWTPGKQRGRPVRVEFSLPVRFRLE